MKKVYATQFDIASKAGDSRDPVDVAKKLAEGWVEYWYDKRTDVGLRLIDRQGTENLPENHVLTTEDRTTRDGSRLYSLVWTRPSFYKADLLWQAECLIARDGTETEFTLFLRVGAVAASLAPPRFSLKRPFVVKRVIGEFECSASGEIILEKAVLLTRPGITTFVEFLNSAKRILPIVLVSIDKETQLPLTGVDLIADRLAGLAHVYYFQDTPAMEEFSSMVDDQNTCKNGEVRLFWPSKTPEGKIESDRPYNPEVVCDLGSTFGERLLKRVAPISAFTIKRSPLIENVQEQIDNESGVDLNRMKEEILKGEIDKNELMEQLDLVNKENGKLSADNKDLRMAKEQIENEWIKAAQQAEEFAAENKLLKTQIGTGGYDTEVREKVNEGKDGDLPKRDPSDIKEALELAVEYYSDSLACIDNALRTAEKSEYPNPRKALSILRNIALLAEDFFTNPSNSGIGPFENWFEDHGETDYRPCEHKMTMNTYGKQREFLYQGETIVVQRHITKGGGVSPNQCLSIYFHIDENDSKFVVCHCGRHLDT